MIVGIETKIGWATRTRNSMALAATIQFVYIEETGFPGYNSNLRLCRGNSQT